MRCIVSSAYQNPLSVNFFNFMNKIKEYASKAHTKIALGALALALVVAHPTSIFAQVSTTTSNNAIDGVIADVSSSMGTNIVKILVVVAGLVALGWGIRKFFKWVGGRKF